MHTKIRSNSILMFALVAAALAFSLSVNVSRAASIFDITFPIAELGGCADKEACKAYCALETNRDACEQFAADHGITTAPKGANDEKVKAVLEDGGPGQCAAGAKDPQASCKAYCDSTDHIDACVSYGKSHGLLSGQQLVEAEKVLTAIKRGAKLPEGCTSESSCKAICENPSTIAQAKSCFAFGKAAGLLPTDFDEARAEKVFQAIQDGTAPFKSPKDFRQCERPKDDATLKKCIDFAVQSGMLTPEQAAVVQKTGGKGPGGCFGEHECRSYCALHQQECFQFSKDNGLVSPEQEDQMKRGVEQFKQNLERVPESVKSCLVSAVGQDTLDAIASGATMPDRDLGERMRSCFEQNRPANDEEQSRDWQDQEHNQFGPAQDEQDRFENLPHGAEASSSRRTYEDRAGERGMMRNQQPQQGPRNIPPQVKDCLVQKYGVDALQKLSQGPPQGELMSAIRDCYNSSFGQQQNEQQNMGGYQAPQMMQQSQPGQMPPQGMYDTTTTPPPAGTTMPPPPASTSPVSILNILMHPISFIANALSALSR